jgi:non-specific serine/threonine protein kinase
LVLDNCEHLIEGCAVLDDALLRACPGLEILATSRAPLRIAGESSWVVPSLSLPDPRRLLPAGELARYEAIHHFVERARPGYKALRGADGVARRAVGHSPGPETSALYERLRAGEEV